MKRKCVFLLFLNLILINIAYCQQIEDSASYKVNAEREIDYPNESETLLNEKLSIFLKAKAFDKQRDFRSAIKNYEIISSDPTYRKSIKNISLYRLSFNYYAIENYEKSRESIEKCLLLNNNPSSEKMIKKTIVKLGFDSLFGNWRTMQTEHFIFHFQNTSEERGIEFMFKKEFAFDSINSFFHAHLPKKIDYYVWNDIRKANSLLPQNLAFTVPALCITHTTESFTLGHEMTHSIQYWAVPCKIINKLIREGTASYFDMADKYHFETFRNYFLKGLSLVEIWKNPDISSNRIVYPLGAELVKRLIREFGREKFLKLLADQSYENALKVYGKKKLNALIIELQNDMFPDWTN